MGVKGVALMEGHNPEERVSAMHKLWKKEGRSSFYCQHLIRSGIKHFVAVQAEQRGRNTG